MHSIPSLSVTAAIIWLISSLSVSAADWSPDSAASNKLSDKYASVTLDIVGPKSNTNYHHWDEPFYVHAPRKSIKWICNQSSTDLAINKAKGRGTDGSGQTKQDVKVEPTGKGANDSSISVDAGATSAVDVAYEAPPNSSYSADSDLYGKLSCVSLKDTHDFTATLTINPSDGPNSTSDTVNSAVQISHAKLNFYALGVVGEITGSKTEIDVWEKDMPAAIYTSILGEDGKDKFQKFGEFKLADVSSVERQSVSISDRLSTGAATQAVIGRGPGRTVTTGNIAVGDWSNDENLLIEPDKQTVHWQAIVAEGYSNKAKGHQDRGSIKFIPKIEMTGSATARASFWGAYQNTPIDDTSITTGLQTIASVTTLIAGGEALAGILSVEIISEAASKAWSTYKKIEKEQVGPLIKAGQVLVKVTGGATPPTKPFIDVGVSIGAKVETIDSDSNTIYGGKTQAVMYGSALTFILREAEVVSDYYGNTFFVAKAGEAFKQDVYDLSKYNGNAKETVKTLSSGNSGFDGKHVITSHMAGCILNPVTQNVSTSPTYFGYYPVISRGSVSVTATTKLVIKDVTYVP